MAEKATGESSAARTGRNHQKQESSKPSMKEISNKKVEGRGGGNGWLSLLAEKVTVNSKAFAMSKTGEICTEIFPHLCRSKRRI